MLYKLLNGNWADLVNVEAVRYEPGKPDLMTKHRVITWCSQGPEVIEFEEAESAIAYLDELAELVNREKGKANGTAQPCARSLGN